MKRIITDKLPIDFTYIQGVAYDGKVDYLVEDAVVEPVDAIYVSKMDAQGLVTETKKPVNFVFEHQYLGWDNVAVAVKADVVVK